MNVLQRHDEPWRVPLVGTGDRKGFDPPSPGYGEARKQNPPEGKWSVALVATGDRTVMKRGVCECVVEFRKEVGMKWMAGLLLGVMLVVLTSGCASVYPVGCGYMKLKLPVEANGNKMPPTGMKTGTSECRSYFGILAVGDASIDTAAKNGGIKQIHYVDWDVENILGILGIYKVTVYGE